MSDNRVRIMSLTVEENSSTDLQITLKCDGNLRVGQVREQMDGNARFALTSDTMYWFLAADNCMISIRNELEKLRRPLESLERLSMAVVMS